MEEKDVLLEQYGILQCTQEQLAQLPQQAIKGKKVLPYGVQALVQKEFIPDGMDVLPVTIEELFIFMVKECA